MDEHLELYDQLPQSNPQDGSRVTPCLLPDPCELSSERAVKMWTGFLYGQPMWTFRSEHSIKYDFQALIAVYSFASEHLHYFAQDAAIDAIRTILHDHSDVLGDKLPVLINLYKRYRRFRLLAIMLADFTVFRGSAEETERLAQWVVSDDDDENEATFDLKRALYWLFGLKAAIERDGHGAPRLMLPCAYHSHLATDRPCYSDDGADLNDGDSRQTVFSRILERVNRIRILWSGWFWEQVRKTFRWER